MNVAIEAVGFNHTPGDTRTGAVSVRRNFATPATLPEWPAGAPPVASVAAYVIAAVNESALMIQASLSFDARPAQQSLSALEED